MGWVRKGECNNCGACCKTGDPFHGAQGAPEIEGACPLLTRLPDGRHVCKEYHAGNPYWVAACSSWPDHPTQIVDYENCSFSFDWIEE